MEMRKVLEEMETNLENHKGVVLLYESRVKILQEAFDKAKKELDEELAHLTVAKDDVYAIEQAIDMLKMGSFAQKPTTEETAKAVPVKVTKMVYETNSKKTETKSMAKTTNKNDKDLMWKHKRAHVLKLNEYDNILDRWPTQKLAARALGWDQSSICKFMKLDKNTQIKRKGFCLAWEY